MTDKKRTKIINVLTWILILSIIASGILFVCWSVYIWIPFLIAVVCFFINIMLDRPLVESSLVKEEKKIVSISPNLFSMAIIGMVGGFFGGIAFFANGHWILGIVFWAIAIRCGVVVDKI